MGAGRYLGTIDYHSKVPTLGEIILVSKSNKRQHETKGKLPRNRIEGGGGLRSRGSTLHTGSKGPEALVPGCIAGLYGPGEAVVMIRGSKSRNENAGPPEYDDLNPVLQSSRVPAVGAVDQHRGGLFATMTSLGLFRGARESPLSRDQLPRDGGNKTKQKNRTLNAALTKAQPTVVALVCVAARCQQTEEQLRNDYLCL